MSLALSSLAIAVLAAVLYALFQKSAPTFSLLVSMAAALILLARVGSAAQSVLSGLVRLEQRAGGDAYGRGYRLFQVRGPGGVRPQHQGVML